MLSLLLILGLCSRIAISVDGRVALFATPLRPSPRPKRCTTSARSRRRNKRGATLSPTTSHNASSRRRTSLASQVPEGDYYGAADSSYVVKEFSLFEQLEDIVNLASKALPRRPDGIVCVAKFTSAEREDCRASEAAYERMARDNPATVFLRAFEDAVDSDPLFQRAMITVLPCFDVFYGGNRVARIEGARYSELETLLNQYQIQNSDLDLFTEFADD